MSDSYSAALGDTGWTPPPEPLRPPIPYEIGFRSSIHPVEPPFGASDMYWKWAPKELKDWVQKHRSLDKKRPPTLVELCHNALPLPCEDKKTTPSLELTIVKPLSIGFDKRSQVVVCNVSQEVRPEASVFSATHKPSPGTTTVSTTKTTKPVRQLVAKLYDPLYSSYWESSARTGPGNPIWRSDSSFVNEVTAYKEFKANEKPLYQKHGKVYVGKLVPDFYGAFKLEIDLLGKLRTVYLVLIHYIPGIPLETLKPEACTFDGRMSLLCKVFEAESLLIWIGVKHWDLGPRNIICSTADLADPALEVTVLDFEISAVRRIFYNMKPAWERDAKPRTPLVYRSDCISEMDEWAIDLYSGKKESRMRWIEYMDRRYGGSVDWQPA